MSVKVYIHLKDSGFGFTEKTSKIQVPKSWSNKPVRDVIELFLKSYESSFPDVLAKQGWTADVLHFTTGINQTMSSIFCNNCIWFLSEDGNKIFSNDTVQAALEDRVDYFIKKGIYVREEKQKESSLESEGFVRCKNYGCNKYFKEEENSDHACQHHTGPPIFHDTMKCW